MKNVCIALAVVCVTSCGSDDVENCKRACKHIGECQIQPMDACEVYCDSANRYPAEAVACVLDNPASCLAVENCLFCSCDLDEGCSANCRCDADCPQYCPCDTNDQCYELCDCDPDCATL